MSKQEPDTTDWIKLTKIPFGEHQCTYHQSTGCKLATFRRWIRVEGVLRRIYYCDYCKGLIEDMLHNRTYYYPSDVYTYYKMEY